ncbi:PKD domain-containing protein [Methanolobus sp. ZRKC2]|uniref:PKD domain-containing protein n=1 Tax=Methanolobus sp. ZRKC2 TaxID=3125783 RepID=UPI0032504C52
MNIRQKVFLIAIVPFLIFSGIAAADTITNPVTITEGEYFVIQKGDSLTINKDERLTIEPEACLLIESGGSLVLKSGATFELEAGSSMNIEGTVSNYGKIKNYGTIDNHGLIINYEINLIPVVISNYGIINDYGTIKNYGTINGDINSPPKADSGGFYTAAVNTAIKFDGTNSSDTDGTIVSYQWDFDGENNSTSDSKTSFHTYTSEGTYEVTLTVIDDQGAIDTNKATVTVTNPNSILDFNEMALDFIPITIPMAALIVLAFVLRRKD